MVGVAVHTDHLDLLYKGMPSQQLVRWRLLPGEFNPKFVYVAGPKGGAAGALGRLVGCMPHNT